MCPDSSPPRILSRDGIPKPPRRSCDHNQMSYCIMSLGNAHGNRDDVTMASTEFCCSEAKNAQNLHFVGLIMGYINTLKCACPPMTLSQDSYRSSQPYPGPRTTSSSLDKAVRTCPRPGKVSSEGKHILICIIY